jgi:hypothetical protein
MGQILLEPQGRALVSLVAIQLAIGTVTYAFVEGWGVIDSLYFCVTTLATVGLGDLAPETDIGKIFTIVYILSGVGLLAALLTYIAQRAAAMREERREAGPEESS